MTAAVPVPAERARAGTVRAGDRPLPVLPALEPLFPTGGLRRGSAVTVRGSASLLLALLAGPSREGAWCAVVGLPALGLVAAGEAGIALERLALVPDPGRDWASVAAALLDAVDVVVVAPGSRVLDGDVRRLAARARQRGAVLVPYGAVDWPGADLRLSVASGAWEGLGDGSGHLRARRAVVRGEGRGTAARARELRLWLPAPEGGVRADTEPAVLPLRAVPGLGPSPAASIPPLAPPPLHVVPDPEPPARTRPVDAEPPARGSARLRAVPDEPGAPPGSPAERQSLARTRLAPTAPLRSTPVPAAGGAGPGHARPGYDARPRTAEPARPAPASRPRPPSPARRGRLWPPGPPRDRGDEVALRTVVVWCPDWPVVSAMAAAGVDAEGATDIPAAVVSANKVLSCTPAARAEGVHPGLRRREAQSRCPQLVVLPPDPARDARAFEPVVAAVEELAPGVEVIRPGVCAVGARGPARYFGGDSAVAARLARYVADRTRAQCSVGVADGRFAAALAARRGDVVPSGGSRAYLAPYPVETLDSPELPDLLRRLGLRTLGAFAGLPARDVLARFGPEGARGHRLARGLDDRPLAARPRVPELAVQAELDPPVERVDTAAFAARTLAEQLHDGLARRGLACTRVAIEAQTEHGEQLTRLWRHEGVLTPAAIADRVRWQLDGWLTGTARVLPRAGGPGSAGRTAAVPVPPAVIGSGAGPATAGAATGPAPPAGGTPRTGSAGVAGGTPRTGSAGVAGGRVERPTAGIVLLRLVPDEVIRHGGLQLGLWGGMGDEHERAGRVLARVQGMLGPDRVVTAVLGGGRGPGDQVRLVPWGDERTAQRPADPPWPGRVPAPSPATVLPEPLPAEVLDAAGGPVGVTGRFVVTAPPARLTVAGRAPAEVVSWTGPWAADERWWDPPTASRRARFQLVAADGSAWLVALDGGRWWLEAGYD